MVKVTSAAELRASPERVLAFLRDYRTNRPRILPDGCSAYRVELGGKGDGTVYAYHFTSGRRGRDYRVHVLEQGTRLEEADQMSSFRSVWSVVPAPVGARVTIETSWKAHGGLGGWIEGYFAPRGMHRIHRQTLDRLRQQLGG